MSASAQERMAARLFLEAVFPTMQVLLDDDPKLHKSFENFHATVQFGARDDGDLLCCHLVFDGPHVDVIQGPAEKPDLTLFQINVIQIHPDKLGQTHSAV